jgi:hypothetical protein
MTDVDKAALLPPEVLELYQYLLAYAGSGNLGIIEARDKATGGPRYTLIGRHPVGGGNFTYVPLGFLSTKAGEEVEPTPPLPIINLLPDRFEDFILAREVEIDRWADDGGACVR